MNSSTQRKTFCRLCEVNCGLEATIAADGRIEKLAPDRDHPVTRGFACHKGLLGLEVHRDPDRMATPLRRGAEGFEPASWDDAVADIAERLRAIQQQHGPRSVAIYMGNPSAFNALGSMSAGMFAASFGVERLFNAGTQDCANKFAIGEILYGSAEVHPLADLDHCDFALLIGTNPRVSKLSFLSTPDPIAVLRAARARGATVRFVNPLALEDLRDVGDTLQVHPDSDAYLLAALLCEIEGTRGFDAQALAGVAHVDRLRDFVRAFPAERVAPIVGLPADAIRELARQFGDAPRAAIHVSTGTNMGRQGSLAYWLAQMLSLVTGNLDREGGNILPARGVQPMGLVSDGAFVESRWGAYRPPRGTPPGSLLPDMIESDDDPIRALIVTAGNPLLSIGGGERMRRALESLDLLVTIDFYRNATGELAHWALPAADWFEREDLNYFVQGVQRVPYLQWTDALSAPRDERKQDWWIFSRLQQQLGLPSLFDVPGGDPLKALWDGRLGECGHSIDELRAAPGGVKVLEPAVPGGFLAQVAERLGSAHFDCCPDALLDTLERAHALFGEAPNAAGPGSATRPPRPGPLKLITRRTHHMLNSALQNLKSLKTERGARTNPLYMNPADANERGLEPGCFVAVHNDHGQLVAELALDANLRRGVVAMSHGFGNQRTAGMPVAQAHPGVNVNALSPTGRGSFDPVSGMGHLTGIAVEVSANPPTGGGAAGSGGHASHRIAAAR